jgi:exodeoxyribonuclease VII large subunit
LEFEFEHSMAGWSGLGGGSAAALSISQLTQHLTMVLLHDEVLQDVWIRGEVSNFTRASSGHLYFSLKDDGACLSCVMWRGAVMRLKFRPGAGMQVVARGRINVYAQRGQYQLEVEELRSDGAGSLYVAFERLKAQLLAEGLLDAARKRPLPVFPLRVALVTSPSGAALRDMCAILSRAAHPPGIVIVPVQVQGTGAPSSVSRGIQRANAARGVDLIIVGRGGGSVEDLWGFNAEIVARAIAASRVPVISAVGHETDVTLADLVADARAATPTAAAEMVVDSRDDLLRRLARGTAEARALFEARLESARLRYEGLSRRMPLARPGWMVDQRRQRLDDLAARLLRAREHSLSRWQHRLALAAGKLDSLSPLATLARGYGAVVRLPEREAVVSVAELSQGEDVRVRLADGAFEARVTRVTRVERLGARDDT